MDAPAVLVPSALIPTRTMLFCAVKAPATNCIPFTCADALLEETARLWTTLRAMTCPLLVPAAKLIPVSWTVPEAAVLASECTVF